MSYQLEFRKLTVQFMEDVRVLARRGLMEGLQKLYVFQRKTKASASSASVPAKKPEPAHKPTAKLKHVPGGGVKCRVPGCRKLSKGPRYHYLCADHRTLPKSVKEAVKRGYPLPKQEAAKLAKAKSAPPKSATPPKNGNGATARLVVIDGKKGIEHDGLRLTYEQWSAKLFMNRDAVRHRLRRGKSPLEAITP